MLVRLSPSPASRLLAFIKLGRPQFLVGGFVLYGLGAALAATAGAVMGWRRYALGQLVVTLTQLSTHYSNDYFDLEADRANTTPTRWSGGSRVLPDGGVPPGAALVAAVLLAVGALAAAGVLAARVRREPLILPGALAMIALAWFYSAPPLRLCARGLGELTTAIVVTLFVPLFGFYLQAGALRALPFLAVLPLAALQFAMLLAIEFPDAAGDARSGKRTLVVLLGASRASRLYAQVVAGSFLALPLLAYAGLPRPVALAAALLAPLALWQLARVVRGAFHDARRWESLAFIGVALLIATATAELAATLSLVR
jgi:1,4-dihydroxy-2-naphthoate octaprenyltransferase